jgi:hypothetical protein
MYLDGKLIQAKLDYFYFLNKQYINLAFYYDFRFDSLIFKKKI